MNTNKENTNDNINNSPFIVIIGLLIAIGRIVLGQLESSDKIDGINTLIVMALVNYIAFGFVLLFLNNGLSQELYKQLKISGTFSNQKRKFKKVVHFLNFVYLIIFLYVVHFIF